MSQHNSATLPAISQAGFEPHAAFFETGRYAAYLGATTEFSKMEGMTYDGDNRVLYASMSFMRNGMTDNTTRYDIGKHQED